LFGPAPLQLRLDAGFLSGDVDIFTDKKVDDLIASLSDWPKAKTGAPAEEVLLHALQIVLDMCRPAFDEDNPG